MQHQEVTKDTAQSRQEPKPSDMNQQQATEPYAILEFFPFGSEAYSSLLRRETCQHDFGKSPYED